MSCAKPFPAAALRPDFIFLDVEASGFPPACHPIEVGLCDDGLRAESWLIKPADGWGPELWSPQSEAVHGVSRRTCVEEGMPVRDLALLLNRRLAGKFVFSDAPRYDAAWLMQLYRAAGIKPEFQLRHEEDAIELHLGHWPDGMVHEYVTCAKAALSIWPHDHRAGSDAQANAAVFRMVVDPAFRLEALTAASAASGQE